jgi:hypothetical protein
MKKPLIILIILCGILLSACASEKQALFGQTFEFKNNRVVDGAEDIEMDEVSLSWGNLPQTNQEAAYYLTIGKDTHQPTDVFKMEGEQEGPVLWIVGGTHGDERAGVFAATSLKNLRLSKGTVYGNDINRAYSQLDAPKDSAMLANGLWNAIVETKPILVLDLHEAAYYKSGVDFLGNTLIYTEVDGIELLFFSMLEATETGDLPFRLIGPGVKDSLNYELSSTEQIPVITVETFRGYPLSDRVKDQLAFIGFVFEFYGMVE